jgi:spore cortex formation protein SpoVR/YcgB (stage V sporulation)
MTTDVIEKPLDHGSEWTFELLEDFEREIARIAEKFRLDTYPNQIEVINSEQMLDAYASSGMPINYHHWTFGKKFIQVENHYRRGYMGLAYEIVINSNPCIAYLMEENTSTLQALVIAHACYGHNSFFKNNYLFRTWTDAGSIIDYLVFAKKFITGCEERHGVKAVETVLDACHAVMDHGVDRYKRPYPISMEEEEKRQAEREEYLQRQVNDLWRTIPPTERETSEPEPEFKFPAEPQENLLYFIEKHAPLMEPWQREIVRIVRKFAQYLYPQRQTKVMNEGWATFWHFNILHEMYKDGLVSDGFMMEFLQHHTNVIYQPPYDSPMYSGINPYTLGFAMFQDIRRVCEHPTDEDRLWFPDLAGSDWLEAVHFAMENFKDESFVLQYLSPKVIRDLRLFTVLDDSDLPELEVTAIHNGDGYQRIREELASLYNLGDMQPNIQIQRVDVRGDRSLTLRHDMHNGRPLQPKDAREVLKHLHQLWGFDVYLESVRNGKVVKVFRCPIKPDGDN